MNNYVQWKDIQQDILTKKHQMELLEKQELLRIKECAAEEQRILSELSSYGERARNLRLTNETLVEKLDKIEESLFDRAREVRRKTLLKNKNSTDEKSKLMTKDGLDLTSNETFIKSLERKYTITDTNVATFEAISVKAMRNSRYKASAEPLAATVDANHNSDSSSSSDGDDNDGPQDHHHHNNNKHTTHKIHRIKQKDIRIHTDPLCDPQTEAILNSTLDHIKRQEISSTVDNHMPISAYSELHSITGSAELDTELRKKAKSAINALNQYKQSIIVEDDAENDIITSINKPFTNESSSSVRRVSMIKGSISHSTTMVQTSAKAKSLWNIQNCSSSDTDQDDNAHNNETVTLTVHSFSCTACYFSFHQRYLQKFPNLKMSVSKSHTINPHAQIRNHTHNQYQFTILEGIYVVKEVIDTLLRSDCVTKDLVKDHIDKLMFLERLEGLSNLREESAELRFQLHYICVNLIHHIILKVPQILLVKNDRKCYVDIIYSLLALLGVVLNCVLISWSGLTDTGAHYSPTSFKGVIDDDRIEYISSQMLELLITQVAI